MKLKPFSKCIIWLIERTKQYNRVKKADSIKYLTKKYLDQTITLKEWEVLLELLDRAENPEDIDAFFLEGWKERDLSQSVSKVTWEQLIETNDDKTKTKVNVSRVVSVWKWTIAASVLALIAMVWWMEREERNFMVYETGNGETKEIILDDGTTVTLNANTRLIWDENWQSSDIRFAELEGEAYFDVSHKEMNYTGGLVRLPFKVRTSDLMINVLGTAFNVSSRRGKTDVFLERGLVKLDLSGGSFKNKNASNLSPEQGKVDFQADTLTMKPGELISFSSETKLLTKSGDEISNDWVDWMDGTLSFRKMEFGIVMSELEDIYGKHFRIDGDSLIQRKVSLALPYENWETVKDVIEMTLNLEMIEYEKNNTIMIKKRTSK